MCFLPSLHLCGVMGARDCWVGVAIDGDGYRDQNWRGRWSYWGFLLKYGEGKVSEEVERSLEL